MKSYNVGIICPSEIAFRRFLPSLQRMTQFHFAGVAIASPDEWAGEGKATEDTYKILSNERLKAQKFVDTYGGIIFEGYKTLIESPDIDVVYLPLPPALHFKWAKKVLETGKHAFVEKPFTTNLEDTLKLLNIASQKRLTVHENYMFTFHEQLQVVKDIIESGEIGKVRLYRVTFGFPRRAANDFRYNKELGGGALLDAGGYCLKYASLLLGNSAKIVSANSCYESEWAVDIFGNATMVNSEGITCQLSFGMDCDYKCELEAWGSTGTLTTNRILTAPDGFSAEAIIKHNQELKTVSLPADNAFEKSICHFYYCIIDDKKREDNYQIVQRQSFLMDEFLNLRDNGK